MRIKYDKALGGRIKKGTYKIKGRKNRMNMFDSITIISQINNHWWCEKLNKWGTLEEAKGNGISNHNDNVKNLKQVIRHIKKHKELVKGTKLILVSRFKGYNIEILV
jgi:hypothetical protein